MFMNERYLKYCLRNSKEKPTFLSTEGGLYTCERCAFDAYCALA